MSTLIQQKLKQLEESPEVFAKNILNNNKDYFKQLHNYLQNISNSQQPLQTKVQMAAYIRNLMVNLNHSFEKQAEMCKAATSQVEDMKKKYLDQKKRWSTEKGLVEKNIKKYKQAIKELEENIQKCLDQQNKRRQSIQQKLEQDLKQIKTKTQQHQKESLELTEKIDEIKKQIQSKKDQINQLKQEYTKKYKANQENMIKQKEQLMGQLKQIEEKGKQGQEINQELQLYSRKNYDLKIKIYFLSKKIPDFADSFDKVTQMISSCKEQLSKGSLRMCEIMTKNNELKNQKQIISNKSIEAIKICAKLQEEQKELIKQKDLLRKQILELQEKRKKKNE